MKQPNLWQSGQSYFEFTKENMLYHGLVKLLFMLFFLSVINFLYFITVNYSYFQNLFRSDLSEVSS